MKHWMWSKVLQQQCDYKAAPATILHSVPFQHFGNGSRAHWIGKNSALERKHYIKSFSHQLGKNYMYFLAFGNGTLFRPQIKAKRNTAATFESDKKNTKHKIIHLSYDSGWILIPGTTYSQRWWNIVRSRLVKTCRGSDMWHFRVGCTHTISGQG